MVVDANIVIAYLAGDKKIIAELSKFRLEGSILFLPTIVEAEILSFSKLSSTEKREAELFLEDNFYSVTLSKRIAHLAAWIRRTTNLKLPDAIIAATALDLNTTLITRDKAFKKIHDITIVTI